MSVAVGKLGILVGEGICQSPVMDVQFSVTDSLQMIVEYAHVHGCAYRWFKDSCVGYPPSRSMLGFRTSLVIC